MKEKKQKNSQKKFSIRFLLLLSLFILLSIVLIFEVAFLNRIYPGIKIANILLSGLTKDQAAQKLDQTLAQRLNTTLEFNFQDSTYQINLALEDMTLNYNQSLQQALDFGRAEFFLPVPNYSLQVVFGQITQKQIDDTAKAVEQRPVNAQIKIEQISPNDVQINVTPSQDGQELDQQALKQNLISYINTGIKPSGNLPIKVTLPKLSYQSALEIKKILDQIKLSPTLLHYQNKSWQLDLATVLGLIDLQNSQPSLVSADILDRRVNISSIKVGSEAFSDTQLNIDQIKLENYLQKISLEIDQPVKEPLFNFDGHKVSEFSPPQDGKKLDIKQASRLIADALENHTTYSIDLPVETIPPKNKLTNDLGIKELIGRGISNFYGSIPNRVFNIGLAASRINGVLIAPGEIFSFNNTVGDISAESGYKQAYVIKSGRTVLDDGGGVCQVSTTLFRAVLNSGLPVEERVAHAYRVGYYEQGFPPGLDATIFAPSVDFKFKNDTPHHVLIQTTVIGNSLYIDLYGSSDRRIATISKPIIKDQTPPPPELRQDDPTLPKGVVKQVDFAAWGANVVFTRVVTRAGETIINETYRSNFRPWQAVFLVGTQ